MEGKDVRSLLLTKTADHDVELPVNPDREDSVGSRSCTIAIDANQKGWHEAMWRNPRGTVAGNDQILPECTLRHGELHFEEVSECGREKE